MAEKQKPQQEQRPDPGSDRHDPMVVRDREPWLDPARTPRDWERREKGL